MIAHILSLTLAAPLLGALAVLGMGRLEGERPGLARRVALTASGLSLIFSLIAAAGFKVGMPLMQLAESHPWIPALNARYHIGADGLSLPLVILTTLVSLVALFASESIKSRATEYYFWFLVLETATLGVFISLDMLLFYVFWEMTLVPMYFLIGIWGGPQRERAAIKFLLYTLAGSAFLLLGILALYFNSQPHTFDMLALAGSRPLWPARFQLLAFAAFYLGFAVKIPAFPFHTWLPLAHVEAPTPVSVVLAALLLKMGVYGLMRISWPLLPLGFQRFAPLLSWIAVINIVYGAFCAMAQTDLKKMVAYSSVNHMGYCLLGLAGLSGAGFSGALFEMVSHGLITGSLFLLVGVIYDRAHTRDISAFGGLAKRLPVYALFLGAASFASLGFPGLSGFISEFLCFVGGFAKWRLESAISLIGLLATAGFFLRMIEKVLLGPENPRWNGLSDMKPLELWAVAPLMALTLILGLFPQILMRLSNPTILRLLGSGSS